ncbi:MAG: hotdog fold thioesterase [Halobacteriovoraceae bacterium]|nr:hotdog fold thioesterase [Halobacteriovoraceae bacterium]
MAESVWFKDNYTLEDINKRGENTLVEYLDIQITEVGFDFLKGTMPVDKRTVQPARILHGGGSCVLAESLGSIAANMVIDPTKFIAVGQSIVANHLRPAPEVQTVTGVARILHLGKKSQIWDIDIANEEGKLICSSRLTMAIIPKFN